MNQVQVEYTYTTRAASATTYGPLSLSDAVCKYHTMTRTPSSTRSGPSSTLGRTAEARWASASNPYYGPTTTRRASPTTCRTIRDGQRGSEDRDPEQHSPVLRNTAWASTTARSPSTASRTRTTNSGCAATRSSTARRPWSRALPAFPWSYRDNWQGALKYTSRAASRPTFLRAGSTISTTAAWHTQLGPSIVPGALLGQTQHLPTTTAGLISYVDGTKMNGCLLHRPDVIEFVTGRHE